MSRAHLRDSRLGWQLCLPMALTLAAVTAYPVLHAVWLSLHRYDLRFPADRAFVGLANYATVLTSEVWWEALLNTALLTLTSVALELALGLAVALGMHHALFARRTLRTAVLVPYAIVTVVAALAWKFAFDPTTGFVDAVLAPEQPWLAARPTALLVIVLTEAWKTTPFVALLLLAGLALVPEDLHRAARVDGASTLQRFVRITLPLMRPAVGVALLFRTLDAFRIFDTVYVQTRGAQGTGTVSIVGYETLIARLNLGLGSAVSVLIFLCVLGIAWVILRVFRGSLLSAEAPRR